MMPRPEPTAAQASVLLRSVYRGHVRWAFPQTLVEETPERVVMGIVPGVRGKLPAGDRSDVGPLLRGSGTIDHVWNRTRVLQLTTFGAGHSLNLFWDHVSDEFRGWYVNLQEPLRRTRLGFDSFDQLLDIWVAADGSWRWKDEHEFAEAVRLGIFEAEEAAAIRAEGERVIRNLERLLPTGWEDWKPDPLAPLPELPDDWARI